MDFTPEELASFNLVHNRFSRVVKLLNEDEPVRIPENSSWDELDLSGAKGEVELPHRFSCYQLSLARSKVKRLPEGLQVQTILDLTECHELIELPHGLTVGSLRLGGCRSLKTLPEGFDCWFLDMTGCWSFREWPTTGRLRNGVLNLRGCTALPTLPDYLGVLASVNLRDCSNLSSLPDALRISGWIDVAHSGLANLSSIPPSLEDVDIRWQGVRIPRRVWLEPGSITLSEIATEKNTEMRRVLIERYGTARYVQDVQAEVLDEDRDPGGARRLLRIEVKDDEPLVTLACKCPSTGRQYFLRVPPDMRTCHQAAAWMAGFDNPDDYKPLIET